MKKQFETKEAFNRWIMNLKKAYQEKQGATLFDQLMAPELTDDDYINGLIADGYTDLDDLVADGHAYQIGRHKNNGWLYRDEIDKYFSNIPEDRIRER